MDLLIIGHGSKSERWNREILQFVDDMNQAKKQDSSINEIKACFLEHHSPSIPEAIKQHQSNDPLMILPLFLSISEHVVNDIPEEITQVSLYEEQISSHIAKYKHNSNSLFLVQPPSTPELIAENCVQRYQQWNEKDAAALLVYYGSKKYEPAWHDLGKETNQEFNKILPSVYIDYAFGGHLVDFSPKPLEEKLSQMCSEHEKVIVLPALVSVGIIQDEVIPSAINDHKYKDQIRYKHDSILPDAGLAEKVLNYAEQTQDIFLSDGHLLI